MEKGDAKDKVGLINVKKNFYSKCGGIGVIYGKLHKMDISGFHRYWSKLGDRQGNCTPSIKVMFLKYPRWYNLNILLTM